MKRWISALAGIGIGVVTLQACTSDAEPTADCANGVRDGDEVGVDCGGSCGVGCTGAPCASGDACASGKCLDGACAPKADKTCGIGVGPACADGAPCELDADCTSGACNGARCGAPGPGAAPGPTNGKQDNGETDVDCGGPNAPPCEDGKTCAADADCKAAWCKPDAKQCVTPTATDGVQNGTETDVDCGGASGVKCAESKNCKVDGDCVGACRFDSTCVDAPSCKAKLGGATCGAGEVGSGEEQHESCCKSLEAKDFTDPAKPGKTVFLDKYEITAGRVRAFVEHLMQANGGNLKAWVSANTPAFWDASFDPFLATSPTGDTIAVPHKPTSGGEAQPWYRNVGLNFIFNGQLFVYVHGHNCSNEAGGWGFPTFYYPKDVQAANGSLERPSAFDDDGNTIPPQEWLDVKSATCVPNYMLAAFCAWDGGQLATDEVLDFVTNAPPSLGSAPGCGSRCESNTSKINVSGDSGATGVYNFPYFADGVTSEGTARIAAPGRMTEDTVRIAPNDEPWMDLAGNVHEMTLDVDGKGAFTGKFAIKYRGIGFSSARAGGNSPSGNISYPEYRAGYSGGRCMRFK